MEDDELKECEKLVHAYSFRVIRKDCFIFDGRYEIIDQENNPIIQVTCKLAFVEHLIRMLDGAYNLGMCHQERCYVLQDECK